MLNILKAIPFPLFSPSLFPLYHISTSHDGTLPSFPSHPSTIPLFPSFPEAGGVRGITPGKVLKSFNDVDHTLIFYIER